MVAGVSVGDAAGVNQLMSPTLHAVSDTQQAAQSLNQLILLSTDEARQGVQDGLHKAAQTAGSRDQSLSLLGIFLQPFDQMLQPDEPPPSTNPSTDIARF